VVGRRKGRSEGRLERNETSMASGVEIGIKKPPTRKKGGKIY
jgi:hypothetical protein